MDRDTDTGGVPALDTKPLIDPYLFGSLRLREKREDWGGDITYRFENIHTKIESHQLVRRAERLIYPTRPQPRYYAYRLSPEYQRIAQGERIVNTLRLIVFPECSDE